MSHNSRVLAIDYGTKRVGIAVSDEMRMLASPRGILPNSPDLISALTSLIALEGIGVVVLGIPKTLAGTESDMTAEVLRFRDKLATALLSLNVPLETRDERLTSLIAEMNIRSRELSKSKLKNKSLRDEEAARILLQEYLDSAK